MVLLPGAKNTDCSRTPVIDGVHFYIRVVALAILLAFFSGNSLGAQHFEVGMETVTGPARTSFKGDLAKMIGFSELEISDADLDTAFVRFDLNAPNWLKELFPGVRVEVAGEVNKKLTRNVKGVRFFARYRFIGGSFTVSDPRLTTPEESRKLKNQFRAVRLSLKGDAEALAQHLAVVALADASRTKPFFSKRYDVEGYIHLKKLFLGDRVLAEWGQKRRNTLDFEITGGMRLTADPSPVVDLGNILFVRERIDELMEGGLLNPVENVTDEIADAIQNVVFGKFRDPRTVPSLGWFLRSELPLNFGGGFSVVGGAELSLHKQIAVKGTNPIYSIYGFVGLRWDIWGKGEPN